MLTHTEAVSQFKARCMRTTYTTALILALAGCGGGGGSSGTSGSQSTTGPSTSGTSITGVVAKGFVSGATITAYCGGKAAGTTLGTAATTDAQGNYSITSASTCNQPVELVATTGGNATELDEASGTSIPATFTLSAYIAAPAATNVQHITPLSDIVAAMVDAQTGQTPTSSTVTTAANVLINNVLNGDAATFNATPMTPAQAIASGNQANLRLAYLLTAISGQANLLNSIPAMDGANSLSSSVEKVLEQLRRVATGSNPGPNLVQLWESYISVLWTTVPLTGPSASAIVALSSAVPVFTAPGSGSTTYTIGGTTTGLTGSGLVLQDTLGESLSVSANGTFGFINGMTTNSADTVRVQTQPSGQLCTVINSPQNVGTANVSDIAVTCAVAYSIGGTVSGLASGTSVVLSNINGGGSVAIAANGAFTFPTLLASGAPWSVTVSKQPTGQGCTITNGSSVMQEANSTAIQVACENLYTITAEVSGLAPGGTLTLALKSGATQQTASVSADGTVSFPAGLPSGADFEVFATSAPSGQGCSGYAGVVSAGANSAVAVTCSNGYFTVGGTVSGLATGSTLLLSETTPLAEWDSYVSITSNESYTLPAPVLGGTTSAAGTYSVTFVTQPANQNCTWAYGAGPLSTSSNVLVEDITQLNIVCTSAYLITGQITLSSGAVDPSGSVTITGVANFPGTSTNTETVYLDGSGHFQLIAPPGTYTVTPFTGGGQSSFSPASASVTVSNANPATLDFTCVSGCPVATSGSGGSVGGGTGTGGGSGSQGSGGTGSSYLCNFTSCVTPLASSCVTIFNDPAFYNWESFTNSTCGQPISLTFALVGTAYGTYEMDLSPGQSDTTGRASSEAPNGFAWAVCPYGYNPWSPTSNVAWNGSGVFICVQYN